MGPDALVGLARPARGVLDDLGAVLEDAGARPRAAHEEGREGRFGDLERLGEERDELVAELLDLLQVAQVRLPEPREELFLGPLRPGDSVRTR